MDPKNVEGTRIMFRIASLILLLGLSLSLSLAGVPAPPEPAEYNVLIRYEIAAFGSSRVRVYREMVAAFAAAGFKREKLATDEDDAPPTDTEADDTTAVRMRGTIPAKGVAKLSAHRFVRALLLEPVGSTRPDKGARVRVDLKLATGFAMDQRQKLSRQTANVLTKNAGFIEAVGYDHREQSRLLGSVPVENLDLLVEDIRKLPAAADEADGPLQRIRPIRIVYADAKLPIPAGMPKMVEIPEKEKKFSPDLREYLASPDADKKTQLEVILDYTPKADNKDWIRPLEYPGMAIEGRLGPMVAVSGVAKTIAPVLAEVPSVVAVRLARSGNAPSVVAKKIPKWEPLRDSGLVKLHALGRRGKGTRMAIIADDFRGWEKLKGRIEDGAKLPDPVLFDLTAERNTDLRPDPYPADGSGYGTTCASSLLRAAPEVSLTLIRIDAKSPLMLQTIALAINGDSTRTMNLEARLRDLNTDRKQLDIRRDALQVERREALANPFTSDESTKRYNDYIAEQEKFNADEKEIKGRLERYFAFLKGMESLKGIRIVASTIVWTDGYPVDGSSALSRWFDDRPFKAALWFQAAGDTGSQSWSGLFQDADNNGLMDFVELGKKVPADRWSNEMNFLSWRDEEEREVKDIPAGSTLRITLQWREAHDSIPLRAGEDPYREPLNTLGLLVVRQLDPSGKSRPADDLEVVARTVGSPQRLNQTLHAGTYEQMIDLSVKTPGRYAVMVNGKRHEGTTAAGEAVLPSTKRSGELRPRLFVRTIAPTAKGRAVWADYSTKTAALGVPADARSVIAVAAATEEAKVRSSSASGSPEGLSLLSKPELLAFDEGGGTGQAASFAAGLIASYWPAGGTLFGVLEKVRGRPGEVLRVPQRNNETHRE
jgi:hypothetical protein